MVYIEDDLHAEQDGPFATFEDAVAELRRRAAIAWDSPPNQAPCTSWQTCGREYHVLEYDERPKTWRLLRKARALHISSKGTIWVEGFEREWKKSDRR
jgi:hypothetical protein